MKRAPAAGRIARLALGALLAAAWLASGAWAGGDAPDQPRDSAQGAPGSATVDVADELLARVVRTVESGRFDMDVVRTIQRLPLADRPRYAVELAKSPHSAMRAQVIMILEECPPDSAAETMRALATDESTDTWTRAALYLARRAGDADARARLLKAAAGADPLAAIPAIVALGHLGGDDAGEVLADIMSNRATPMPALAATIGAAGLMRAQQCLPALIRLLDDERPREQHPADTARICDMAAASLEQVIGFHRLPVGGFFGAPYADRDQAIEDWREWAAEQEARPDPNPRLTLADGLLSQTLELLLSKEPPPGAKEIAKRRLRDTFRTTFCLGDLPGVTALVAPSVQDQWRIMKAHGENHWYKFVNSWSSLQLAYVRQFLAGEPPPGEPDAQAAAFIVFADGTRMPKEWIWSFCRDFAEIWPESPHAPRVAAVQERAVADLAGQRRRVVLHGRMAVLEPIPRPPPARPPRMVQEGYGAIVSALDEAPSNWELHRQAIGHNAERDNPAEVYLVSRNHRTRYPANSWPFVAAAAYELRVLKRLDQGVDYATRALILNESNAKAYAIRGMLRVTLGKETDAAPALADLERAYELNADSLGDEPETHAAIAFMLQKALEAGDAARAKALLEALGPLRDFPSGQPFQDTEAHAGFARAAAGM